MNFPLPLRSLLLAACFTPTLLSASTRFSLDFDQLNHQANIEGLPGTTHATPEADATVTRGNSGEHGEGAIIAAETLDDFAPLATGEVAPSHGLRFMVPEVLSPREGSISIGFRPFYNGEYQTFKGSSSPSRIYYLFDSGRFDPNKPHERIDGIQLLIKHTKTEAGDAYVLMVSFALDDGRILKQTSPVAATPDAWHNVRLSWNSELFSMEFDKKPLMKKPIDRPLAPFEEFFTIGGSWYGTWPLQGLIDTVEITAD